MNTQTKTATFQDIKTAIEAWFLKHRGEKLEEDAHFYTPAQWRMRGEDYGNGSNVVLCMTFDGSHVYDYMNMHDGYKAFDDLVQVLGELGVYFEMMHSWSFAVYAD